jgi:hypothetical protein
MCNKSARQMLCVKLQLRLIISRLATLAARGTDAAYRSAKPMEARPSEVVMLSAWMQRLETLFVAVAFAEAGEFETARQIVSGTLAVADARS